MRAIFEKLGAAIEWDNDARKVKGTKGNRSVVLAIDSASTVINNKATTLDVKPIIVNETTMVPIRVVSESLGAKVEWDNETRTVSIISSN